MFFVKVEMCAADWQQAAQHLLLWRVPFSRQTQAHIGKPPRLSFSYFHWFLVFFIMHISTYWNLMLWYIKHIYFQKLLIYVKVRDTNLAICFFLLKTYGFLLWDSYGYIYWRGKKSRMICWRFMQHDDNS